MTNQQKHNQTVRAVTALLLGVMALPLASQVFMQEPGLQTAELIAMFNEDIEAVRQQAAQDRDRLRMQRRAYTRATERCLDRLAAGEKVECPDISDFTTFTSVPTHAAAPEAVEPAKEVRAAKPVHTSVQQLATEDRKILRSYTRAGFCSKVAGVMLYTLCMEIVGEENTVHPSGFENDNKQLRSKRTAGASTLRLRLKMIDEALSGTMRTSVR